MSRPPNVLLIIADQWRAECLGVADGPFPVQTPNIDALALRGMVFDHCVTPSPLCCPARCALASGQRPGRFGILDNQRYLPLNAGTMYQHFRDHGYWTGLVGKLDIEKGHHQGRKPRKDSRIPVMMSYGFCDHRHASSGMVVGEKPDSPYQFYLQEQGWFEAFREDRQFRQTGNWCVGVNVDSPLPTEHHVEHYAASQAIEFIHTAPELHPWFLQLSFDGPHDPFDPPTAYADQTRELPVPGPIPPDYKGKPSYVAAKQFTDDTEDITIARRQYLASIKQIDDEVGRVLMALDEAGQTRNTIVVFTSDHGEMLGDFGLYQKQVPYEASIRVPLVMAGPGIPKGKRSQLVDWMDLHPTLCDLSNLPVPERLDARSFYPVIQEEAAEHRDAVLVQMKNYTALRTQRYLYVENINDIPELYDLEQDPDQLENLLAEPASESSRKIATELSRKMFKEQQTGLWLR